MPMQKQGVFGLVFEIGEIHEFADSMTLIKTVPSRTNSIQYGFCHVKAHVSTVILLFERLFCDIEV